MPDGGGDAREIFRKRRHASTFSSLLKLHDRIRRISRDSQASPLLSLPQMFSREDSNVGFYKLSIFCIVDMH